MKPNIAETGWVEEVKDNSALVRMGDAQTCRKCGMAALGLCRPGGPGTMVWAENRAGARKGDRVEMGLDRAVRRKGLLYAFALPLAGFVIGAFAGNAFRVFPGAEVVFAAVFLAAALIFGIRKLKELERDERMHVSRILGGEGRFEYRLEGAEGTDYLKILNN